jgi:hypothetical protein
MMDGPIRACTHPDITSGMIEEKVALVREIGGKSKTNRVNYPSQAATPRAPM